MGTEREALPKVPARPPREPSLSSLTPAQQCQGPCFTDDEIYAPLRAQSAEAVREEAIRGTFAALHGELAQEAVHHSLAEHGQQAFLVYRDILVEIEVAVRTGRPIDINGLWERAHHFNWNWDHRSWMWLCNDCSTSPSFSDTGPFHRPILGFDTVRLFDAAIGDEKPDPAWWERALHEILTAAFVFFAGGGDELLFAGTESAGRMSALGDLGTLELAEEERLGQLRQFRIQGAGASPRTNFRENVIGTPPRTLDEAVTIARRYLALPEGQYSFALDPTLADNITAEYYSFSAEERTWLEWNDIAEEDVVRIRLNPNILTSDEKIVAAIAHEVHETDLLLDEFLANGGRLRGKEVYKLVIPTYGQLHFAAWDYADDLIERIRAEGGIQ